MPSVNTTTTINKIVIDPKASFGSENKPEVDYYVELLVAKTLRGRGTRIEAGTYHVNCVMWHGGEKRHSLTDVEIEVTEAIDLFNPLKDDDATREKLIRFLQQELNARELTVADLDKPEATNLPAQRRVIKSELHLCKLSETATDTFFLINPILFRDRIGHSSDKQGIRLEIISKKLGQGGQRQFNECVSIFLSQPDLTIPPKVKLFCNNERGFLIGDVSYLGDNEKEKLGYMYDDYKPKAILFAKLIKSGMTQQFIFPMRRIHDKSLLALIQAELNLSMPQLINLSQALIAEQERFEKLGLLHRDIKPANIMIELVNGVFFKATFIDVEASLFLNEYSEERTYTPEYSPVEIIQGHPATLSSDFSSIMLCVAAVFGRATHFTVEEREALARHKLEKPELILENRKLDGMFENMPHIPEEEKTLIRTLILNTTHSNLKLRRDREYAKEILHYLENKYSSGCAQLLQNIEWLTKNEEQIEPEAVQTYLSIADALMRTYGNSKNLAVNLKANVDKLLNLETNANKEFHQRIKTWLNDFEKDLRLFSAAFHGTVVPGNLKARSEIFKSAAEVEKTFCAIQACTGLANYILKGNKHLGFFNKAVDPNTGAKRAKKYLDQIMQVKTTDEVLLIVFAMLAYWDGGKELKQDIATMMGIPVADAEEKLRQLLTTGKSQVERDQLNEIVRQQISSATGRTISR